MSLVVTAWERAIQASNNSGIAYENAVIYNAAIEHTYLRTIGDVFHMPNRTATLKILEIGSFTGVVSIALKHLGYNVTASDLPFVVHDPGFARTMKDLGIRTIATELSNGSFPAADREFELIIFNEVLEHLNFNPIPLLREFHRILSPHGRVYCATPNLLAAKNRWLMIRGYSYRDSISRLRGNLERNSGMSVGLHWREWTKAELLELFNEAGFDLLTHRFGLYTPNRSRILRRLAVWTMYKLAPQLMPNQIAVFKKNEVGPA